MHKFAEVIFNIALDHSFSYKIPSEFRKSIRAGMRVLAPLGKQFLTGIVVELKDKVDFNNLKEITDLLDDGPLVSDDILKLTKWIADYYLCSWGQAIFLSIPKGIDQSLKLRIFINEEFDQPANDLQSSEFELRDLIFRNPGKTYKYYQQKFGKKNLSYLIRRLIDKKILKTELRKKHPQVREKKRFHIKIPENIFHLLKGLKTKNKKIAELSNFAGKEILLSELLKTLDISSTVIDRLVKLNVLTKEKKIVYRFRNDTYEEPVKDIKLTTDQKRVLKHIKDGIERKEYSTYLLHGVTGSGKTQIYIESIIEVIKQKKSAIILIPEISLTPQTVNRFEKYFKDKITVYHSKMSLGERYDAWFKIFNEDVSIVIGPRSSMFLPVSNLGIIIVDEEHDNSYKQGESVPRYHARDAVVYLAKMKDAVVVLGSATPSLESYFNAYKGKYKLLELSNRISNMPLPKVSIVDIRSIKTKNESAIFSPILIQKIRERLDKSEQIILLQNRRGHSSFLQCTECGYLACCPNCEISLTYHKYNSKLRCHYCDYNRNAMTTCSRCNGIQIHHGGIGTQKIESEMKKLFPDCRYLRMDQDTTKNKYSYDEILHKFKRKQSDILLGTQMISKGLDFENVTLVGVISADVGLNFPDFRSAERTFQLLTQVAGRSGRGVVKGEVVVQSYQPDHEVILMASKQDYSDFYIHEMNNRKELFYPPFTKVLNIRVIGLNLKNTIETIKRIAFELKTKLNKSYKVVGPAPAPIAKINNFFRWHLLVKIENKQMQSNINLKNLLYPFINKNSNELRIQFDFDPIDLM